MLKVCAAGGFNLIKFVSNSKTVLNTVHKDDRAKGFKELDFSNSSTIERALGVCWCIENDSLSFRIILKDSPLTRRGILYSISSVYDPLGLAAPFLLLGKKLLQTFCREKKGWDEPITDEQRYLWERWRLSLPKLEEVEIPRCFKQGSCGEIVDASLHHFSDASTEGYGQSSYIRLVDDEGNITCNLVMGKSRVTPLKLVTIPRLELTAAVVSVKVSTLLKHEIDFDILQEIFWTDSKVFICYINNEARRFHTFVANCVQLIRDYTDVEQWRYVSTHENPADDASRGLSVEDYLKSRRWFHGLEFLHGPSTQWPSKDKEIVVNTDDPEVRKKSTNLAVQIVKDDVLATLEARFSDLNRLQHVIATMLKWRNTCSQELDVESLKRADRCIIKMIQTKYFAEELKQLDGFQQSYNTRYTHPLKKVSNLYKLDPFVDKEGLIRVGGQIQRSEDPYEVKHPLILPRQCNLTRLLIHWMHQKTQHSGRNITLNELRNNGYWIINANSLVKLIISDCVTCRAKRGVLGEQNLADLPTDRLTEAEPFTYIGLDLFGPFTSKTNVSF